MRDFIVQIAKFVVFVVALYLVTCYPIMQLDNIDNKNAKNLNIKTIEQKNNYSDLDVLFLGNSYCYSSINSFILDSLGIETYNLAIASAGPYFYELLLNDYLKNISSPPKDILLLISPLHFSSKADNFSSYPIHRYLDNPLSNWEVHERYDLGYRSLILLNVKSTKKGIKNIWDLLGTNRLGENVIESNLFRGFRPDSTVINDEIISETEHFYIPLKSDKFNNDKFNFLIKWVRSIDKMGLNVTFFEVPTYRLEDYFSTQFLDDYELKIKRLSQEYSVYRMNDLLNDSIYFRNLDHMNLKGSELFTMNMVKHSQVFTKQLTSDNSD